MRIERPAPNAFEYFGNPLTPIFSMNSAENINTASRFGVALFVTNSTLGNVVIARGSWAATAP